MTNKIEKITNEQANNMKEDDLREVLNRDIETGRNLTMKGGYLQFAVAVLSALFLENLNFAQILMVMVSLFVPFAQSIYRRSIYAYNGARIAMGSLVINSTITAAFYSISVYGLMELGLK